MKRIIESLNEMSFTLPEGWSLTKDVYSLPNGQGMTNKENYLSSIGEVISLFEVHRDPDDFFDYYDNFTSKLELLSQKYILAGKTKLKLGEFIFPIYVIKDLDNKFLTMQVFVNCGNCLGCFMIKLDKYSENINDTISKNHILGELIKLLRTVQ